MTIQGNTILGRNQCWLIIKRILWHSPESNYTRRPHGPLTRYVKLLVAHAPGMPGTFSPPPRVSYPDLHHGTCVKHVPWCMPGSLTSGFLWSRWRGKRSRHSWHMRNPQICVSRKSPMSLIRKMCSEFTKRTHTRARFHLSMKWLKLIFCKFDGISNQF